MTYIIAGKLKNENFLMVDTIVDNNINNNPKEKIYRSIADKDLYISLTGDEYFMNLIQCYDNWEYRHNRKMIFNINTITILAKELENIVLKRNIKNNTNDELKNNRIYFVNQNDVGFFDVIFNNNIFLKVTQTIIQNNQYAICLNAVNTINSGGTNSYTFCNNTIQNHYNYILNQQGINPNIQYFSNGFSFYSSINGYKSYCANFNQYANDILV